MQFKLWFSDHDIVTIDAELEPPGEGTPDDIPEVTKATVSDAKLSNATQDQLLAVVGQCIDLIYSAEAGLTSPPTDLWDDKTRDIFRSG